MGHYGLLLSALLPEIRFEKDFSLALHTTVGVGGNTAAFLPLSRAQLFSVVRLCERCNVRYFPLGGGSNVLPADSGFDGVILSTSAFDGVSVDGEHLTAECGVGVGKLLSVCKRRQLTGLEFLAGIPAKVGGLTYMNAGTADGHVGDCIESVTFLRAGKVYTYTKEQCQFSYKTTVFQQFPCVILSVRFALKKAQEGEVFENISRMLEKRKHLPTGKSMGCTFKNPTVDLSAGKLIEDCNLKGFRVGGAVVSPQHANFILNDSHATAQDYISLIEHIKRTVRQQTGVRLEEEIRYIR